MAESTSPSRRRRRRRARLVALALALVAAAAGGSLVAQRHERFALGCMTFPVQGGQSRGIGSPFGAERGGGLRRHRGVDLFAPRGTPVLAAADGRVWRVGWDPLGGRVIWQRDPKHGAWLYYAHLDRQLVRFGQRVSAGDVIGLVGNTGNARTTPPHLHFGVYAPGAIDPAPLLPAKSDARVSPPAPK